MRFWLVAMHIKAPLFTLLFSFLPGLLLSQTIELQVSNIPAAATGLTALVDGGMAVGVLKGSASFSPGTSSTTLSVGVPAGSPYRVRVYTYTGSTILRAGKVTNISVANGGSTPASVELSDISITVDPSTPSSANAGSVVNVRLNLFDAGNIWEGTYGGLYYSTTSPIVGGGTPDYSSGEWTRTGVDTFIADYRITVPTSGSMLYYWSLNYDYNAFHRLYTPTLNAPAWQMALNVSCSSYVTANQISFASSGGISSFDVVYTHPTCPWNAQATVPWIMVDGQTSGTGPLSITISPNTTGVTRTGLILVANKSVQIIQSATAQPCSYSAEPTSINFPMQGAASTVQVSAPAQCPWTAVSKLSYANVTNAVGTGTGSFTVTVGPNPGATPRSGSITVGALTINFTQAGRAPATTSSVGDFNGDGRSDVIWQNDSTRQTSIWYMGGAGGNTFLGDVWLAANGPAGWRIVGMADLNSDGKSDVIWQNDSTRQASIWYMGGAGGNTFLGDAWLAANGPAGWRIVGMADLNSDGKPDLIWQNDSTRQASIWYMGGAGGNTFLGDAWLAANGPSGWRIVGVADLNSDGKPDVVWQNDATRQVSAWYMGGAGGNTFLGDAWLAANGPAGWRVAGMTDLNSDTKPDLIWQNDETRQVSVWYMGGTGGNTFLGDAWLAANGPAGWTALVH